MSVLTPLGVFAKNARSLYIGTRNKVFNPNRWCLSVFLDPRLSGCMNHTVDPKLKQGDLICRATSGLRSCKVASFISVACDHVNLKTDTLPRHTCKSFSADSWRPGNIVLSDVIDTHTHTRHMDILARVRGSSSSALLFMAVPHIISNIAPGTYLALVSSSPVL